MASIDAVQPGRPVFSKSFAAAGILIGTALSGFFDGILLHQVLQWHHLLSLVDSPAVQDIRVQILADGLFHLLMYIVAAIGLALLWKSHREFSTPDAARWLFGTVLLGFGLWNFVDVGLFHWIMRIHRIRVDVDNPMFWDVSWLILFGVPFLVAGWMLRSRSGPGGRSRIDRNAATAAVITIAVTAAGLVAALPPKGADTTTLVMFRSGATPAKVFQAFDKVDARVVWADRTGTVWAVKMNGASHAANLYRHGAILVSNSAVALGCFSWLRT